MIPGLVAGLVLGLLALGPGLRRGFLLTYDMVFVPREPFSAALPGLAPPRAVPSDLVSPSSPGRARRHRAEAGAAVDLRARLRRGGRALRPRALLARLAGGVFYAWNPYVAERLIIGQWALLLGYAGLPWVLRAVTRPDLASWRWAARLALVMVPAVIGGFAAMAVTALVLVPGRAPQREHRAGRHRAGRPGRGQPAVADPVPAAPGVRGPGGRGRVRGAGRHAVRRVGSLLMLGGEWNAQTVPKGYGGAWSALWLAVVLAALAGFILLGRPGRAGRAWASLARRGGLAVASIGVTAPGRDLLRAVIGLWPGIAVFRDAQQFVAPLALAEAAGLGLVVAWAMNPVRSGPETSGRGRRGRGRGGARDPRPAGAGAAAARPGLGRRGTAAAGLVPGGWLAAARMIDDSRPAAPCCCCPGWPTARRPGTTGSGCSIPGRGCCRAR